MLPVVMGNQTVFRDALNLHNFIVVMKDFHMTVRIRID